MNTKTPTHWLRIGGIGFGLVLALNLIAITLLNTESAKFFTTEWYTNWLPIYAVWGVFIVIGLGVRRVSKPPMSSEKI